MATTTDANGNVTLYVYDADDRLASLANPVGNVTVFGYDALSRLASLSNPAIQANPLWRKTYSPDGLVASFSDAFPNTTNYAYDGFDRLSTTTFPDNSTEVLTYDADFERLDAQDASRRHDRFRLRHPQPAVHEGVGDEPYCLRRDVVELPCELRP